MTAPARRLILASGSTYRRELLQRLIDDFESIAPDIDEHAFHESASTPDEIAETLAQVKATVILSTNPQATVIGSDQLVDLDGEVLGKPGTETAAVEQLIQMSGRTHRLVTAVCIADSSHPTCFSVVTSLSMRRMDRAEIQRYVTRDQPLNCAGSYRIEQAGISLFDRIDCEDFTAIVGLPLLRLSQELRSRGYAIP